MLTSKQLFSNQCVKKKKQITAKTLIILMILIFYPSFIPYLVRQVLHGIAFLENDELVSYRK